MPETDMQRLLQKNCSFLFWRESSKTEDQKQGFITED